MDNCIYYANATHSLLSCLFNENYIQVICADTNLNVKWKKYIKVANDACAATHYTTNCDVRPGVLVAGSTYNTTDPQNLSLRIPFIYRIDSAVVASIDPFTSSTITDRIIVSPNPAKKLISVKDIEGNLFKTEIFDFSGRRIRVQKANNSNEEMLYIESYAPGWYLIRATTNDGEVYNMKILKN